MPRNLQAASRHVTPLLCWWCVGHSLISLHLLDGADGSRRRSCGAVRCYSSATLNCDTSQPDGPRVAMAYTAGDVDVSSRPCAS